MPMKLNMQLSNGTYSPAQLDAHIKLTTITQNIQQTTPTAFNSPMVGRVHNVRPGCGSCGR